MTVFLQTLTEYTPKSSKEMPFIGLNRRLRLNGIGSLFLDQKILLKKSLKILKSVVAQMNRPWLEYCKLKKGNIVNISVQRDKIEFIEVDKSSNKCYNYNQVEFNN